MKLLILQQNFFLTGKSSTSDILTPEAIPCRKWAYGGKLVTINDTAVVGAQKTSTFDHLLTARYAAVHPKS